VVVNSSVMRTWTTRAIRIIRLDAQYAEQLETLPAPRCLTGEVEVRGETFNGAMPGLGPTLSNAQIAAAFDDAPSG
jgi:hypothetical protein